MYESYWRLTSAPFENDANPAHYFPGRSHHGALLKLRYLIENRKGVGLVVGGHGAGKSFLTHVLEQQLAERFRPVVRLVYPQLTPSELLSTLAVRLGEPATSVDSHQGADVIFARLERRLTTHVREGQSPVIIIDEAHLLETTHLQTLQLLLNLQQQQPDLFSLVLCGRPDLLNRVRKLPALHDRVAVRTTLHPLSEEESTQYIKHRLKIAGLETAVFDPDALRSFWQLSQGVPRKINQLCDLSLLVGFADGLEKLTRIEVEAAAEELCGVSAD
ncbi:MAG: AAA family ATPase [Planctomycetaceae bacterium]